MSRDFNAPKVLLTQLREYISRNGNTYFSGYMGRTKLVLLRDHDAECTGNEVARWNLWIEEAPSPDERRPANNTTARAPLQLEDQPAAVDIPPTRKANTASDRRAADLLRERGVDPDSQITDDPIPF